MSIDAGHVGENALYRIAFGVAVNMALFTRPAHIPEVVEACLTYSTSLAAFQNPNKHKHSTIKRSS